jgi:hypothetical protein
MDTSSINPASIIDEAVDLSMRLAGTDFPVSIFPTKIQRIISEVHECHNYPTDYIASAILTAIAVGIGNTHLAQIKQGWIESPILYMALIGRPGANKSHPLSFAMKPFLDYDYQQNQVFEKALAKYDELMSMSRKERAESGEEQFPQEPVRKRFLISDVTPEGLSLIHAQNKRGLCLGLTSYPLGSRTSTVITTVRKNSSGCRCSVPRPLYPTQECQKFHLHQATVYLSYWYYSKEDSQ